MFFGPRALTLRLAAIFNSGADFPCVHIGGDYYLYAIQGHQFALQSGVQMLL